uniref:Uncharacterized protein n=1 Tax=Arundo donax TaxID=35708 RepID=A0A0A9CGU3_ARUDO
MENPIFVPELLFLTVDASGSHGSIDIDDLFAVKGTPVDIQTTLEQMSDIEILEMNVIQRSHR